MLEGIKSTRVLMYLADRQLAGPGPQSWLHRMWRVCFGASHTLQPRFDDRPMLVPETKDEEGLELSRRP